MAEARADFATQARLMRLATYASVSVATILIGVKFGAWVLTDSVSMLSTLVDSVLDALASLLNLYAVNRALQPPDREHRFGHGKAEPLAGLGQSAFIAGSSLFLTFEAGRRLFDTHLVERAGLGIGVMVVSILATLCLVAFQRYVIKRTKSVAINADSLHYVGDLMVNVSVIIALVLAGQFGFTMADPIFAFAIAGYILWLAWHIFRDALDQLMDREFAIGDRDRIKEIALAHPEVLAIHDLRTRSSGRDTFIQLHLEMHGAMALLRAHDVADQVEREVMAAFPEAEVLIHQDPFGLEQQPGRTVAEGA
jgi:ferrous-iron efflux pump FieF